MGKDMLRSEINEMTQREWREFGFFYDSDDDAKEWRLVGTKAGLRQFAHAMQKYAAKPSNDLISAHEHFGAYSYLALGTWATSEISDHWLAGSLKDIQRPINDSKRKSILRRFYPDYFKRG